MSCAPIFVLKRNSQPVTDICFWSCNDQQLKLLAAYQGGEESIAVWDVGRRRVDAFISVEGRGPSTMLSVSTSGIGNSNLITLDRNGWLKVHDGTTLKCLNKLNIEQSGFCKASTLGDDMLMLAAVPGLEKSSVTVWSLRDKQIVARLLSSIKRGMVMVIKLLSMSHLVAAYENGSIVLWNLSESSIIAENQVFPDSTPIMAMDAHHVTDQFITCFCAGVGCRVIKIEFDLSKENQEPKIIGRDLPNNGVASVKVRQDGKLLITGGWDHRVRVFGRKLKPLAVLGYHHDTVQAIDFADRCYNSNEGALKLLACASKDNKISFYDIYND